ncbi:MAG: hypothetical protein RIR49_1694 [Actinomycetota bacterium]|jgi:predicted membrane channel-forming protein YqfA (hemolysin III family)
MLAIEPISTGYQVMGLLHILTAISTFGPMFLYPGLKKAGETATIARLHMRLTFPSLVLLWVLGMGLAGMSKDRFELTHTWLALSIVIWVVLVVVSWMLIRPAITDDSPAAVSKMAAGTGVTHLLLVVALILMVWKPGDPVPGI